MTGDQNLSEAVDNLTAFFGTNPLGVIRQLELALPGLPPDAKALEAYLTSINFSVGVVDSALEIKRLSGQINVVVHAAGIVASLPYVLEPGETILSLSLGAGNTGKDFDLTTDRRIAEFKFISWRGGAEAIRQNQVFKDYLKLLWHEGPRRKQLFLTGTKEALHFLRGGRALGSVLSRNVKLKDEFLKKYGTSFNKVGEFFQHVEEQVEIIDLREVVPFFAATQVPPDAPALDEI